MIECEMCLHFLSCYTVELQLPTDACSLPGNQHSISPSTSSPQTHTCAGAHRQHTCAHKHTNTHSPSLTSQRLRFRRRRKSLLTAGAAPPHPPAPPPHFVVDLPPFLCLFQRFSQSLKPVPLPLPEGTLAFSIFNIFQQEESDHVILLPKVKSKCVIRGQRHFYHVKWKICSREVTGMQVVLS